MVKAKFKTKSRGMTPRIAIREMNSIKRQAYHDLGVYYHKQFLPKRFTQAGGRLLGYAKRSLHYQRRKRKRFGHNDPLVWSGLSRSLATKIQKVRATATSKRSQVRIAIMARALNFRHPQSNVRPSDEVRRIAPSEVFKFNRFLGDRIDQGIKERDR